MRFPFSSFKFVGFALLFFCAVSCVPARKAIFFNGLVPGKDSISLIAQEAASRIYPGDRISVTIIVEDQDMQLLNFGLSATANVASGTSGNSGQSGGGFGYLVDKDGNIELVKIGVVHVAGKTPKEIADAIKQRVSVLYRDPQVYCTLSGRVLFLGAGSANSIGSGVFQGGAVPITNDRLTILEAFSLRGIGDPTAVRDRVWVIRERGEEREIGSVDINSKDVFQSPYYYLRNNDIIYMEPNRVNTFLTINAPVRSLFLTGVSTLALIISLLALLK